MESLAIKRIAKEAACYAMSARNKPVARVRLGERFCLEVQDCYGGELRSARDVFTKAMWSRVNPATGPVYVAGVRPGDILAVGIERVRTRASAVMCVERGSGALGGFIRGVETTIHPIRGKTLVFNKSFSFPIRPMIGVIGTAPRGRPVPNGTPGEHGGNMDCRMIAAGATVYLPVNVPGALLMAGDLHALMGDGEVCICGAETSGEIVLKTRLVHAPLPTPCVETKSHLHFIGSAADLDACEGLVLAKAHAYLTRCRKLKPNDAARAMSLVGQLEVCQVVDPLKTMRFSLPKALLHIRQAV